MTGRIFNAFALLCATLLAMSYLIIPGLQAAGVSKNLGALALIVTLACAWGLLLVRMQRGER